ncbi:hypothetical protein [Novosphingobium sp. HII-3]|uniref:hypothetical protein n=1 Tax=Novosphingobium sp. HII-3 TaxID=2075565 RepID=UPI000CDABDBE|nr:hypothetical protein [Novosphingobium sp. HII-3]
MIEHHSSPSRMAYVLARYIDDPRRIRSHVLAEFQTCPGFPAIERMRAAHKRRPAKQPNFKMPSKRYPEDMARSSNALLKALHRNHPYVFDAAEKAGRLCVRP